MPGAQSRLAQGVVVAQAAVVAQDLSLAWTVLRGMIDLVHQSNEGWRILDCKSDQLDGITDADAEFLARCGLQLAHYRSAWECAGGGKVVSTDLVALRATRTIRVG